MEVGITAQIPIRLLTDFCFHEKAARCPSGYPKAFRLLPKMAAARYVLSYSKLLWLLRKPYRLVASPKSGNLYILKKRISVYTPHPLDLFFEKQFIPFWLVSAIILLPKVLQADNSTTQIDGLTNYSEYLKWKNLPMNR